MKIILIAIVLVIVGLSVQQALTLRKAHATFENYYAFRGCVQLIKRTDTYGICKTDSGKTIKIVKYQGKWFLDKDLPFCLPKLSFICLP